MCMTWVDIGEHYAVSNVGSAMMTNAIANLSSEIRINKLNVN